MDPAPASTPDELQVQARALGDPTRSQIFQYIGDSNHPVDVRELTEHFGFNHNAIRQHIAKLLAAGLILEQVAPSQGRGRPRHVYTQDPAASGRWGGINPYEQLSMLMSEMLRTGDDAVEVGRRAGRRQRLRLLSGDTADGVVDAMARLGFEPTVAHADGETVQVVQEACPFASAAIIDPDIVCALHKGITEGLVETAGDLEVEEMRPGDPRHPHCVVTLHHAKMSKPQPTPQSTSQPTPEATQ